MVLVLHSENYVGPRDVSNGSLKYNLTSAPMFYTKDNVGSTLHLPTKFDADRPVCLGVAGGGGRAQTHKHFGMFKPCMC